MRAIFVFSVCARVAPLCVKIGATFPVSVNARFLDDVHGESRVFVRNWAVGFGKPLQPQL